MNFLAHAPATTFAAVAASQTGSTLVASVAGRRIIVVSAIVTADANTTLTFKSGATAISPAFTLATGFPMVLYPNGRGWFRTAEGQALTCDTGSGGLKIWLDYVLDA